YPSAGNCRRFSDTEEGSAKRCCINREIRRAREKPRPYALCGGGLTCCEWTQKVLKRCEVDDPVGNANAGLYSCEGNNIHAGDIHVEIHCK
ncbi:MAG: hypothetical protein KC944_07480, partial [Candidatus Omnitrophica bacterium]|nr:hypothetical protein [Candidatus Omnitrophota bacterium]